MLPESPRSRRGMPLTLRLTLALTVASFFVALLVTMLGADRRDRDAADAGALEQLRFAQQLADRISPFLERGDLLRMSMLATAGRDLANGRILVLDRRGKVALDTALVLGDRQLGLLTHGGAFQRRSVLDDQQVRESLVPVRFGGDPIGELRMQVPIGSQQASFETGQFGLVLLCCLTLVAVAGLMAHHWSARVRSITDSLVQLATGQLTAEHDAPRDGELHELDQALQELEKGVHDGLHRVVDSFIAISTQVIDGMERRGLVPHGHAERTARYAGLLAERLELRPGDCKDLELACRLHDLGKAWLRPAVLKKSSALSAEEQHSLASHPVQAADHLESLPGLRRVAAIVRHQNERHDGTGSPDNLRGERIPLGARVLAIASAFDLLTTCGESQALDWEAALEHMATDRGEVFDPWLLDLFDEEVRRSPPAVTLDKPVMIMPGGTPPYRIEAAVDEGALDSEPDGELEVMLDDSPPEETL